MRFQGGRCAGCRRRVGVRKHPATDHNHAHCPGPTGCIECVRGFLCSTCNRFLGYIGDDPETLFRLGLYVIDPPWPKVRRTLD